MSLGRCDLGGRGSYWDGRTLAYESANATELVRRRVAYSGRNGGLIKEVSTQKAFLDARGEMMIFGDMGKGRGVITYWKVQITPCRGRHKVQTPNKVPCTVLTIERL